MKTEFEITAVWNGNSYNHFGIHPSFASIYGDDPDDIEILTMKISEDQTVPEPNNKHNEADYWGWLDNDDKGFHMIYAQRFLLDICFPAGIARTEKAGQGKAYRLTIIEPKINKN